MSRGTITTVKEKFETRERENVTYPEVLLQVVDCYRDIFAALFQLNVWESWEGEVQTQVLH